MLEFLNEKYQGSIDRVLNIVSGQDAVGAVRSWVFVAVLLVITFISYQGQTLSFPGKGGRPFFDLGHRPSERLPVRGKHMVLSAPGCVAGAARGRTVHGVSIRPWCDCYRRRCSVGRTS